MMKRLTMLVIVAVSAIALAYGAEVVSENVVGFKSITSPGQSGGSLFLAGMNFDDFGKSIDEAFRGQLTGATSPGLSDQIIKWDPTINGGQGGYVRFWTYDDGTGTNNPFNGRWVTELGSLATNEYLVPGEGFWIKSRTNVDQVVHIKGEARNDGTITTAIAGNGLTMIANPYPAAVAPTNMGFYASGAHGGTAPGVADQILFWNGTSYERLWLYENTNSPSSFDGLWITEGGSIYAGLWEVGQGAFYKNRGGSFSWVAGRPYADLTN
jgi:hypothetical protein